MEINNSTKLDEFVSRDAPICYGILKPGQHIKDGIPVVKVKNIFGGKVHTDGLLKTSLEIHEQYKRAELKAGDVLLTIRGTTGRVAIVPNELDGANITQDTARIRVSTEDCSLYLYYALQSPQTQWQISLNTVGQAVKGINIGEVRKLNIYHPPQEEQRQIAKILSTWDKSISTTERLIDNSKQQKRALMQQLLTGRKRLVGYSKKWISEPLGNVVGRIYGGGTPSRNEAKYWSGEIPWVTVKDLIANKINGALEHITEDGLHNSSTNIVPAGTVIIATRMALGKAVVSECDVAINQDLKAVSSSDKVASPFLHYWFLFHSKQIERLGTGSTVKGVQLESIKSLKMFLPSSLDEQNKIAEILTNSDKEIELLGLQLADLKQEKKALMQQLLTGKRRVKVDASEAS